MARLLANSGKRVLHDDDGTPFETVAWPISNLIEAPKGWSDGGKLTLELSRREQAYLAGKLRAVRSPSDPSEPSLLSKLVGKSLGAAAHCWDREIIAHAGNEAPRLKRAGQAAALSAIGRAIYAAQVETLKESKDKRPQPDRHRAALTQAVDSWGKQARQLDMAAFLADVGQLPSAVDAVLKESWAWLGGTTRNPMDLLEVYGRAETKRKGDRARLASNQFGVDRRMEWQGEHHGNAEPLHYRWGNVKRLLRDLEGIA